jgi:hypothetical protein
LTEAKTLVLAGGIFNFNLKFAAFRSQSWRMPRHGRFAWIGAFIAAILACVMGGGQALARSLTTEEIQIFRATPPLAESNKTPASLKLIEIAKLPEDKTAPPRSGHISIRTEDIQKDGLLCSTEWLRTPKPLGDARSREVAKLLRILSIAPADATLDRGLFGPGVLGLFSPEERKAVEAMLAERARVESMARDLTPENLTYWIRSSVDTRLVKLFIARRIEELENV